MPRFTDKKNGRSKPLPYKSQPRYARISSTKWISSRQRFHPPSADFIGVSPCAIPYKYRPRRARISSTKWISSRQRFHPSQTDFIGVSLCAFVDMRFALDMLLCNSIYLPYGKFDMRFARCFFTLAMRGFHSRSGFHLVRDFIRHRRISLALALRYCFCYLVCRIAAEICHKARSYRLAASGIVE